MTDREAVELLPVEQCDRDAAAEIVRWGSPGLGNGNKVAGNDIKGGLHDSYAIVQAFAKHRIASNPVADSGLADELADCDERFFGTNPNGPRFAIIPLGLRDRILSALRANPIGQSEGVSPCGGRAADASHSSQQAVSTTGGIPDAWRPIETIDETDRCLVWVADGGPEGTGGTYFGRCNLGTRSGDKMIRAEGLSGNWQITHWRPLPEPPASGIEAGTAETREDRGSVHESPVAEGQTPNPSESKHPTASPGVEVHDLIGEIYQRGYNDGHSDAAHEEGLDADAMSEGTAQVQADFVSRLATLTPSTERDAVRSEP